MKHITALIVCAAIALALMGCGGGSGSTTTTRAANGRLTLSVVWPKKTATTTTVTMASTIDHVTITPANPTIAIGDFAHLTMNAFDASGNMVLAALTTDFESANTDVATVAVTGNPAAIKGISAGASVITVTEKESGKTAGTTVTVSRTNNAP